MDTSMTGWALRSIVVLGCLCSVPGCRERAPESASVADPKTIRLATTTSVENSGLLDHLVSVFQEKSGIQVHVLSMGTGAALQTARNGDCDVVLVHSRQEEDAFVASGYGTDRRDVMYNRFVILGPKEDPAGIKGLTDAAQAFRRIAEAGAPFCSRGDEGGTHKKEKSLWRTAGLEPGGHWYLQVGQGMAATLTIADQKRAYVLADEGTFLSLKDRIDLSILAEGDPALINPYGIIAVSPQKHPHVHHEAVMEFIDFLTGPDGGRLIDQFRPGGRQLFRSRPHQVSQSESP